MRRAPGGGGGWAGAEELRGRRALALLYITMIIVRTKTHARAGSSGLQGRGSRFHPAHRADHRAGIGRGSRHRAAACRLPDEPEVLQVARQRVEAGVEERRDRRPQLESGERLARNEACLEHGIVARARLRRGSARSAARSRGPHAWHSASCRPRSPRRAPAAGPGSTSSASSSRSSRRSAPASGFAEAHAAAGQQPVRPGRAAAV